MCPMCGVVVLYYYDQVMSHLVKFPVYEGSREGKQTQVNLHTTSI